MLETINITLNSYGRRQVEVNGKILPKLTDAKDSPTGFKGIMKDVYIGDEYIVKFGDIGEAEFLPEPEDQDNFAKVVYASVNQGWYVQERINCIPRAPFTEDDVKRIEELVSKYNIGDIDWYDASSYGGQSWTHNWIVDVHGTPVIFDYSSAEEV